MMASGCTHCDTKARDGCSRYVTARIQTSSYPTYSVIFSPVLFCFLLLYYDLFCSVLFCSILFCSVLPHPIIFDHEYLFCSPLHRSTILFLIHLSLFQLHAMLCCSAQLQLSIILMPLRMIMILHLTFLHVPQAPTPTWALNKSFLEVAVKKGAEIAVEF